MTGRGLHDDDDEEEEDREDGVNEKCNEEEEEDKFDIDEKIDSYLFKRNSCKDEGNFASGCCL